MKEWVFAHEGAAYLRRLVEEDEAREREETQTANDSDSD